MWRIVGDDQPLLLTRTPAERARRRQARPSSYLDFWSRCRPGVKVVLLAMSDHRANLFAVEQIRRAGGRSYLAATAKFPDQAQELEQVGADAVFNFYANAGAGLAEHAVASVR
jgi:hypothetical protein